MACGILAPWSGLEPVPPALGAQSFNHLTAREVSAVLFYYPKGDYWWITNLLSSLRRMTIHKSAKFHLPSKCILRNSPVDFQIATRKACGLALAKLGHANDRVIVLDGDTKNSTFSDTFKREHPERFIKCFTTEQNMVCVLGTSLWVISLTNGYPLEEACPLTVFLSTYKSKGSGRKSLRGNK